MAHPVLHPNALTKLETVKRFLGTNTAVPDDVLIRLINQASAYVEQALGRKLGRAVYTEQLKGNGNQYLLLSNYPIVAVEHVKQAGDMLDPSLWDYEQGALSGVLYKDTGWTFYGFPHGLAGDPITGSRNIEVRYTAGYILPKDGTRARPADLPADIEGLVLDMIQHIAGKMQSGGNAGLKSFAISDVRWEWQTESPPSWQAIIDGHKRYWI